MARKHFKRREQLDGSDRDMERNKTLSPKVEEQSDHENEGMQRHLFSSKKYHNLIIFQQKKSQ